MWEKSLGWDFRVYACKIVLSVSEMVCRHPRPANLSFDLKQADYVSAFPGGVNVAATWDRNLARARGVAMGEEHRGKGVDVQLGPVCGPLGRSPEGGRNWVGYIPRHGRLDGVLTPCRKDSALIPISPALWSPRLFRAFRVQVSLPAPSTSLPTNKSTSVRWENLRTMDTTLPKRSAPISTTRPCTSSTSGLSPTL